MMMRTMLCTMFTLAATLATPAHAGEGSLDRNEIRKVVRAHIDEVRVCYNKLLASDPAAAGEVVVDFVIASTGAVKSSSVKRSSAPAPLGQCVAGVVAGWKFPAPTGGDVAVEYPFLFEPG